jgi:hypothetical protein
VEAVVNDLIKAESEVTEEKPNKRYNWACHKASHGP